MYLHVFDWPANGKLSLKGIPKRYAQPVALDGGRQVPWHDDAGSRVLDLSKIASDPYVTVISLQDTSIDKSPGTESPTETDQQLHSDGSAWGYQRTEQAGTNLPRVLLIGDSILNGYRGHVSHALKGVAIVDVWVNPHYQSEQLNKLLGEVLEQETYDVVHFNVGLHGWQEGRIKVGAFKPLTRAYVEVIAAKQPNAKLIWASSTPVTVNGEPEALDPEINPIILDHNRMAAEVMERLEVPVNDFYGLLANRLELARGDSYHWTAPAYELLGDQAVQSIRTALAEASSGNEGQRPEAAVRGEGGGL